MTDEKEQSGYIPPQIRRGSLTSLSIYEVMDYELDILESGGPGSTFLNFSVFLLSVGMSFLIVLLTVKLDDLKLFAFFLVVTIVGLLLGVGLLIVWNRSRFSVSRLCIKIRDRIKTEEKQPDSIAMTTENSAG